MADSLEKIFRALGIIEKQPDFSVADTLLAKLNGGMPQLDQFEAQSIGQILDYKNRYESAQKAYNTASRTFNDVNSTQAAKSQAQSDMAAAQHIMDEAHKSADFTRRVANNRGIDLSNYDAYNTSLDDANVNFVTKAQQDVSDLFAKDLTPDQFYDRTLRVLLSTGVHLNQAKAEAARRTRDYAIDREARFNTAMQMYGQNGNGALTDLGIQMMDKFGRDHPDTLNLYGTMYATPSKQYDNAVQAARDQNTQANAMAMALLGNQFNNEQDRNRFLYNLLYGQQEFENQAALKAIDNEYKTQDRDQQRKNALEDKENERQYQAKLKQEAEARAKSFEDENTRYLMSAYPGMSESEARLHARGILKMSKDDKDSKDKEEKLTASDELLSRGLTTLYREARDKPSEENIQAWEQWFNDNALKLPPDMHIEARYFAKIFRGLQNKRNGDDNGAAMEWSVVPPALLEKYLPEYNWDFYRQQWYGEVK